MVKRSKMTIDDLDLRIIDDRPWLLRKACHGDPSRTFWIRGRPLPLCSRCISFYPVIPVGGVLGWVLFSLIGLLSWQMLIIFTLLEAPLVIDGWTQYIGWRRSNNRLRSITGALAGIGIGAGVVYMLLGIVL